MKIEMMVTVKDEGLHNTGERKTKRQKSQKMEKEMMKFLVLIKKKKKNGIMRGKKL